MENAIRERTKKALDIVECFNLGAGALSGIGIILFIVTIVPDALTRSYASYAMQGIPEFNILTLVVLVFLAQAGAQCRKEHFQVRVLLDNLPEGLVPASRFLIYTAQLIVAGTFAWLTTTRAIMAYSINESTFSVISFPVWPARIVIALGFWMLTVQLLIDLFRVVAPDWAPSPKRGPEDISEYTAEI
ncbi:TRAP transporter small permease [Ahrensia kielensis]|uniref:TRAP transporter small permease n=1 Tax=Ahrensia kielensis TaxID=76980 RepID=UPI000363777C|nr:TRAP transporter small permease [Ahrensia kielensis]